MSGKDIKYYFSDPLHIRINDFIEGCLSRDDAVPLCDYLDANHELKTFVAKSKSGMQAARHHFTVSAADDFEDKLQQKIAAISHSER